MIALASDHGGYALKEKVKGWLTAHGYDFVDCGTDGEQSVDYPVFAKKGAAEILSGRCDRGIFFCGTGLGISMAANRIPGIRAAVCESVAYAEMARRHNNANVLCLGGRYCEQATAFQMVNAFLTTPFDGGERHERRLAMLDRMETL